MLPALVLGLIVTAILAVAAYSFWRVLNIPAERAPSYGNTDRSEITSEPLPENDSFALGRVTPQGKFTAEDRKLTKGEKMLRRRRIRQAVHGYGLVTLAVRRTFNRPQMVGGDADLGWKNVSLTRNLNDPPVLNVSVFASGRIEMDGKSVRFDELSAQLLKLQSAGGKVRYFQEQSDSEPREAGKVMDFILDTGLPVVIAGSASTAFPDHSS